MATTQKPRRKNATKGFGFHRRPQDQHEGDLAVRLATEDDEIITTEDDEDIILDEV